MDCEQTRHLLDAYLDGELDLVRNLEVEEHLETCNDCSIILRNRQTLRAGLSHEALYYRPSALFEKRLQQNLRRAGGTSLSSRLPIRYWLSAAALLLVVISAGLVARTVLSPQTDALSSEVLSSHLRSLMADHLEDVISTDQHTVKPWFDGKLDFSPPVVDLAAKGYPLIGGRLDYLDNRDVAALVYQARKHVINVFIWPVTNGETNTVSSTTQQGYQLIHWVQGGMNFWAVSDVNSTDLQTFTQEMQKLIEAPTDSEKTP